MLEKQFEPKQTAVHAKSHWSPIDFQPQGEQVPFCIMLPPPNVTGTLHMGHAFQHSLMDALIRYHRMMGDNTLWQPGTDHAGIATQIVVEKLLAKESLTRKTIGRKAFERRVWEWKNHSGNVITEQMQRLGASADWTRERFTMDEGLSQAVNTAFIKLYRDGLIYRGTRLVNWDPVLGTALSDLEVISSEEKGCLWYIRYPLLEPIGDVRYLTVATTRPETLFGDVAVAVNPTDERYKNLIGKKLILPLSQRHIPIIGDEYVDAEFGTGCVKITPAHDFNDFAMAARHQLESINIFTTDAKLNDKVPEAYQDLSREEARQKVLDALTNLQLLTKTEPHQLMIPRSERSGAIVEPYLTKQWYVTMDKMAKEALAVVEDGTIEFVPDNWRNTYRQWLNGIQDWCISRQLWWGHRIPAWYDVKGNIYVGQDLAQAQAQAGEGVLLVQDEDVLDTWFSAALWPFSTLGWPQKTEALKTFYPTNVLVTGFDIIFFWVARMIMFGLYFTGRVPFKKVLFTGLIRDHDGQKMSKSKGNVIDPIDLIDGISLEDLLQKRTANLMLESQQKAVEKATRKEFPEGIPAFGEDALRFTYCALATHGRDIRFDLSRMEGYRNFCNKIWNATRFIQMQMEKCGVNRIPNELPKIVDCDLPERWLISKLNVTIASCHRYFAEMRFDLLAQTVYDFVWHQFCDRAIERAKMRLNEAPSEGHIILQVIVNTLNIILHLLHPLMPFITEDLWQQALKPVLILSKEEMAIPLMRQAYPQLMKFSEKEEENLAQATQLMDYADDIITSVNALRHKLGIKPKEKLPEIYLAAVREDLTAGMTTVFASSDTLALIKFSAKVDNIQKGLAAQNIAIAQLDSNLFSVQIPWQKVEAVLTEEEKIRLLNKQQKLQQELGKAKTQFINKDKMPPAVVTKLENRMRDIEMELREVGRLLNG